MSGLDFIKIDTNIFNNSKIRLIENRPDGDAIIVIWFKLLALAGREFPDGVFIFNGVACTDEMLAVILDEHEGTVSMALETFTAFHMVEIRDGAYYIPNWEKWQSPEAPF